MNTGYSWHWVSWESNKSIIESLIDLLKDADGEGLIYIELKNETSIPITKEDRVEVGYSAIVISDEKSVYLINTDEIAYIKLLLPQGLNTANDKYSSDKNVKNLSDS